MRVVLPRSLLGFACGLALAVPAHAAGTTPVRIVIEAPDGCSSPRAFFEALRARTDRIHLTSRREGLELRITVTRAQNKVRGELRVVEEGGASSARSVEGASCDEVVHALSLTAALVVDQIVPPLDAGSARPSESEAFAPSDTSASSATAGAKPSEDAASRDQKREIREERKQHEPRKPGEQPEERADDVEQAEEPDDDIERPSEPFGVRVEVGAQAIVGEIISPRVSVGGALFASVNSTSERAFSPSVGLAIAHVPAEFGQAGGDLSVRWTAAMLTACPVTLRAGDSVAIRACALGTGGQLVARGESTEVSAKASRSWWSAGVLGRASLEIGSGATLRFELGLSVPLARRRFITTPPDKTVGESPSISAIGGLGVAHAF